MGALLTYLRCHPWQRRVLTVLAAVSVSGLVAVIVYPHIRNDALRRNLGSDDEAVQRNAIREARALMVMDSDVRPYLEKVATNCDDPTFLAVTKALSDEMVLDLSKRPPEQADRYRAIMLEQAPLAMTRCGYAWPLLVSGRVNEHTRRAASRAAVDEDADVRAIGAALAAKVGDEALLRTLLSDTDTGVVATAALDAGLTGHTALAGDIAAAMESRWKQAAFRAAVAGLNVENHIDAQWARTNSQPAQAVPASAPAARSAALDGDLDVISNAALALSRLAPREYSERLAEILEQTDDPLLRARLLHVMPSLERDVAERAVLRALEFRWPEAAAMLAGAQLGLRAETEWSVRAVLEAVASETGASEELLRAACQAAIVLDLDVGETIYQLMDALWDSYDVPLRVSMIQLLAAHARRLPQTEVQPDDDAVELTETVKADDAPESTETTDLADATETAPASPTPVTRAECLFMLRFFVQSGDWMDDGSVNLAAAVPAVVAACELLAMGYPDAWDDAKAAAAISPLAAFELGWRLSRDEDPQKHIDLILSMLPDPRQSDEDDYWALDTNIKVAAAVWMGLTLQDNAQAAQARQRIIQRLNTVSDPYLRQTYDAALLALGQRDLAAAVRKAFVTECRWVEADLLWGPDGQFPQFLPVYGALLVKSGDRHPLDWLLASDRLDMDMQMFLLQGLGMANVARLDASLPTVDPSTSGDLRIWQVNILRHAYILGKSEQP